MFTAPLPTANPPLTHTLNSYQKSLWPVLSAQHSLSFQTQIPHLTRRMLPTKQGYNIFLKSIHPDLYASVSSHFPTANKSMLLLMPKYFHYIFADAREIKNAYTWDKEKYSIVTCSYHIVQLTWFSEDRAGQWRTEEFCSEEWGFNKFRWGQRTERTRNWGR